MTANDDEIDILRCSRTSAVIDVPRDVLFAAFMQPEALAAWQAPGDMTAVVHAFDPRPGGGYRMSLFYPESDVAALGKSAAHEDRFTARYLEIVWPSRIVQAIEFESEDPAFGGEMTMTVTLEEHGSGTEVTFAFADLPAGVRPEDNEEGTHASLTKLAQYVGGEIISIT